MSEVKRYWCGSQHVLASDYDAAQSELAALREELAQIKESTAYRGSLLNRTQLRAEAAEQRNATLETELRNIRQSCELSKLRDARIDELLAKPTESGASKKAPKCCQCGACPGGCVAESKP